MANTEKGFSLVELMVAMTVTLIISGAVFQLMSAGQTAFRREPELADRQQNIRMGMNVLGMDVYRVGYGVPHVAQALTANPGGGFAGGAPDYMLLGQAIRYRIAPDAEGVPNLERSAFGGQNDMDGNST